MALADYELERIASMLPEDSMQRTAVFMEINRVTDVRTVNAPVEDGSGGISINNALISWGWNPAASLLLAPLPPDSPFPFSESTADRQAFVTDILRRLGCQVLARRGAEMLRAGFVRAVPIDDGYRLCSIDATITMAMHDSLDVDRLEAAEGFSEQPWEGQWHRDDIDALMIPLMRPYPTPFGTMLAYDAIPEVDAHFLGRAIVLANRWLDEAGLHPETRLGLVTGAELLEFAQFFASFHLKHIHFVGLAISHLPAVSPVLSLTIWKPRAEMIANLAEFMEMPEARVEKIVEGIAFRADEAANLRYETTPLRPMLIDLGNGFDLWPVSALDRNPFETIRRIHERRDPTAVTRLAAPREEWFRDNLYGLFDNERFECVEGNIKVQVGGRIVTDIDAAIYDRESDQLALFQIKWQDFSTNSPKELGSKARNFMNAMNLWAGTVTSWLETTDIARVMQSMRLKSRSGGATTVHLFGVSRALARLGAMAKTAPHPSLALGNWAQLRRIRLAEHSRYSDLATLHGTLAHEHDSGPSLRPIPMSMDIGGRRIEFADNFFLVDEEHRQQADVEA